MFSAKSDSHLQFWLLHILIHTHTHVGSSQGKYRHTNGFVWLHNGFTDNSSGFRNNIEGFTKKIGGQCICQHLYLMIPGCQVVFPPAELVFPGAVHIGASDGSCWSFLDICFNLVDLMLLLVISCNFMLSCYMCLQEMVHFSSHGWASGHGGNPMAGPVTGSEWSLSSWSDWPLPQWWPASSRQPKNHPAHAR